MAILSSSIIQSLHRMLSRLSPRPWNHKQKCCFPPEVREIFFVEMFYCHFFVHAVEWQVDKTRRAAACRTAAVVALYQTFTCQQKVLIC